MTLHQFSQDIVPIVGTTVGLFGLFFVWLQIKAATEAIRVTSKSLAQASNWNKINATYAFFDLSRNSKIEGELYAAGKKLGITFNKQLTGKELDDLVKDNEAFLKAKEFLNDFESYCVAYKSGVLDKELAFQLLGTRLTKEYRVFSPLVKYLRTRFEDQGILREIENTSVEWQERLRKETEELNKARIALGPVQKDGI